MRDFGLVLNGLFRKSFRTALLLMAIFVAFLIFGVLASFNEAINADADMAADNRLVVTNKINFTQPLPIAYVRRIENITGVDLVSYAQWFGGYFQEPRNFLLVFAVDPESYLSIYDEYVLPDEQREAFFADRTGLLVGRSIAERYGWSVGDQIPLQTNIWTKEDGSRSWPFTIRGIYDGREAQTGTDELFFHYEYLDEGRSFSKDLIGTIVVRTTSPAVNERVIQTIDEQFANSRYQTSTTTLAAFEKAFISQIGNIGLIISSVTAAAFVTVLLIVGNAMAGAIRERTKEIAVLKTLGFTGLRIGRIVFLETLILALIGGGLGLLAANAAAAVLSSNGSFSLPLTFTSTVLISGFSYILLLAFLTAAIPVAMAFRLSIVTALGRE